MNDFDFQYYEQKFSSLWGANVGRYLANEFHRMMDGCDCIDNHRYAEKGTKAMSKYWRQEKKGCCGSSDREFVCEGKSFWLGFNYGH